MALALSATALAVTPDEKNEKPKSDVGGDHGAGNGGSIAYSRFQSGVSDAHALMVAVKDTSSFGTLVNQSEFSEAIQLYLARRTDWMEKLSPTMDVQVTQEDVFEGTEALPKAAKVPDGTQSVLLSEKFFARQIVTSIEATILAVHETGHLIGEKNHTLLDKVGEALLLATQARYYACYWPVTKIIVQAEATMSDMSGLNLEKEMQREFKRFFVSDYQLIDASTALIIYNTYTGSSPKFLNLFGRSSISKLIQTIVYAEESGSDVARRVFAHILNRGFEFPGNIPDACRGILSWEIPAKENK